MNLAPDTSTAIMQAAQGQTANIARSVTQSIKDRDETRLDTVAKDFEAMFVSEMMKPMFAGIKPDDRFGGGKGEEIFSGLMLQEYGKMIAETGQLGIATMIKQELINMQEQADNNGKLLVKELE